jgi:hypothetical protein
MTGFELAEKLDAHTGKDGAIRYHTGEDVEIGKFTDSYLHQSKHRVVLRFSKGKLICVRADSGRVAELRPDHTAICSLDFLEIDGKPVSELIG